MQKSRTRAAFDSIDAIVECVDGGFIPRRASSDSACRRTALRCALQQHNLFWLVTCSGFPVLLHQPLRFPHTSFTGTCSDRKRPRREALGTAWSLGTNLPRHGTVVLCCHGCASSSQSPPHEATQNQPCTAAPGYTAIGSQSCGPCCHTSAEASPTTPPAATPSPNWLGRQCTPCLHHVRDTLNSRTRPSFNFNSPGRAATAAARTIVCSPLSTCRWGHVWIQNVNPEHSQQPIPSDGARQHSATGSHWLRLPASLAASPACT